MKLNKICFNCSKEYLAYQCNVKNSERTFCTIKCYGEWQKTKSFEEQGKKKKPSLLHCIVIECIREYFGRSYCKYHYYRFLDRGKIYNKTMTESSYKCLQCLELFKVPLTDIKTRVPKFCSVICRGLFKRKPFVMHGGYKKLLLPDHHRSDVKGYVFEHIVVMEKSIGRPLKRPEVVHHIDRDKGNNNIENLMLFPNQSEHIKYHKTCRSK